MKREFLRKTGIQDKSGIDGFMAGSLLMIVVLIGSLFYIESRPDYVDNPARNAEVTEAIMYSTMISQHQAIIDLQQNRSMPGRTK